MKYPRTAEGYAQYIRSEHWDRLRTCVLERDGYRCVRCGSGVRLQAHHKFYRDDWEEAQPSDLETLCKACHEREHSDKYPWVGVTVTVSVHVEQKPCLSTRGEVETARREGRISRHEFLRLKAKIFPKRRLKKWRPKKPLKRRQSWGCKPWHYSPRRMHWVNRGTSSN